LDVVIRRQLVESSNIDYYFFYLFHNQHQLQTALNVRYCRVLIGILAYWHIAVPSRPLAHTTA